MKNPAKWQVSGLVGWVAWAGFLAAAGCGDEPPVSPDNRSPVAQQTMPAQGMSPGDTVTLDLSEYFADADGDALTYGAEASPGGVVAVSTSGAVLTIAALAGGSTTVTVTATDPEGLTATQSFAVDVGSRDWTALVALYRATGGPDWRTNTNWLSEAPLGDWHGITVNGDGRVTRLDLIANNLAGPIPPEIGKLTELTFLRIYGNLLTGELPGELGSLSKLEYLNLSINEISGSIPPEIGNLRSLRELHIELAQLSGPLPPEMGNLGELAILNFRFNGLTGPVPPEMGNLANLVWLDFFVNQLAGPLPAEMGNLASLSNLNMRFNIVTGSIPAEWGRMSRLVTLDLGENMLSGPIPAELGDLGNLEVMDFSGNRITGPIPSELGQLSSLDSLNLSRNALSGPIPAELGDLASLTTLAIDDTNLTEAMPPQLGQLSRLVRFTARNTRLEGPIPPEFSGMASLRELNLTNSAMEGPLPAELTEISDLDKLLAGGTGICAPSDREILSWLGGVYQQRVQACQLTDGSTAYLVQSVQSRAYPVPLVAHEPALLRVFPVARMSNQEDLPPVRATFYLDGAETHEVVIPSKSGPIFRTVFEADLAKSSNADIPAEVLKPGVEMVIEIDPDETLDPGLGVTVRIPETGRLPLDVREMPVLDLTLIPFLWAEEPDSAILDIVRGMADDPREDSLFSDTRTLMPVAEIDAKAHQPVVTSTNSMARLLLQTEAIRKMESGEGRYMGMMSGTVTRGNGAANEDGTASSSVPVADVVAHELGHNFSLLHAPCGFAPGPDVAYPHRGGLIGAWGYDVETEALVAPQAPDLMSYCDPAWVSEYHFSNALRFRMWPDGIEASSAARPTRSLLIWGGRDPDGRPFLEPAFIVDAHPALPPPGREYRIIGRTDAGQELFSFSFDMPVVADGEGETSGFVFLVPVSNDWADALAGITLAGPDASVTLGPGTERPALILKDPRSGQVVGILTGLPAGTEVETVVATLGLDAGTSVMVSRGVPEPADRLR